MLKVVFYRRRNSPFLSTNRHVHERTCRASYVLFRLIPSYFGFTFDTAFSTSFTKVVYISGTRAVFRTATLLMWRHLKADLRLIAPILARAIYE